MKKIINGIFCLVLGLIVGTSILSQGGMKSFRTDLERAEYIIKYNANETLKKICLRLTRNETDIEQNATDISILQGE